VNFAIRPMENADLADAADIVVANFAVDGNPVDRYALPRVRERLAGSFRRDEHAPKFVVAVNEGERIVGVAGWGKLEFASRTWALFLSCVDRDHRGRGVGTALVRERLRRIGEETQTGRVLVSTRHRKRFERLGFRPVDFDRELSLYLMLKRIGAA